MSELTLDRIEVKAAIKAYVEEKHGIWQPDKMISSIHEKDDVSMTVPEIVVVYDLNKWEDKTNEAGKK